MGRARYRRCRGPGGGRGSGPDRDRADAGQQPDSGIRAIKKGRRARIARAHLRRLIAWRPVFIVRGINQAPAGACRAGMPMLDVTATEEIANDARARSNVLRLAAAQALTG